MKKELDATKTSKPVKWTKETISKEAKKYKTRSEFQTKSNGAYKAAWKLGILDEVCSHMVCGLKNRKLKWTKEAIQKEAKKYKTRKEFDVKAGGAYYAARKLGILDEVCSHMVCGQTRWTIEAIKKEAKKYKTRSEFSAKTNGAYGAARKLDILDEVCSHMQAPEFHKKRCVYVFLFEDDSFYVGLTYNFKTRHGRHKNTNRFKNKIKNNISYTFEHTELMPYEEAQKLEGEWEKKYLDLGYKKLNISKTGSLGGSTIKWTKEAIKKEAKKYKTRKEFYAKARGAYNAALKEDILNKVCSHMAKPFKWTKDKIKEEAKKYKTRNEFKTKSRGAHSAAWRLGLLDEVCSHMPTRSQNKNNVLKFPSKKANAYKGKEAA